MDVRVWEEEKIFPTYELGSPDKNPLFLENRVYQGSSGKVYPLPVIERVSDKKADQKWKIVVLENQWLTIWILPALGGRIHRALDKTNGYDFVYFNHVIKPALVGLAGPWISGGIEFNWPQHHRPSTFSPVEYALIEEADGSKGIVLSEIDKMYGTKGQAKILLHPNRAFIEIQGCLNNRTNFPQTFLWWANPAVAVNEETQSVFPPDVHAVMDHGKRDTSRFPIATGIYYKTDYSAGVDISKYKNIPVPTSYMAYHSDFNFIGHWDAGKQAGLLHVADHHVSPGKKQWTWGCGDFGKAWDRNLTDSDGPYIELMTGVFTDNQPDFTWLAPQEEKTFTQIFMPYKNIGLVKNANAEAAVSLDVINKKLIAGVYVTGEEKKLKILISGRTKNYIELEQDLAPEKTWTIELPCEEPSYDLEIRVTKSDGTQIISYKPIEPEAVPMPETAKAIGTPDALPDAEALWLAGQHLEQYRHATYKAEDYYKNGLSRFPEDIRLNNALGILLLRRGLFSKAEQHFRNALKTLTRHNTNPSDGETSFNLGLALEWQKKWSQAEDAYAKSAWSGAWQDAAFFALARLALRRNDLAEAEAKSNQSLIRNCHNFQNRHLLSVVLRLTKKSLQARSFLEETLNLSPLDFGALRESILLGLRPAQILINALRDEPSNLLALVSDYNTMGLHQEAIDIIHEYGTTPKMKKSQLLKIQEAQLYKELNDLTAANNLWEKAAELSPDFVFPNRLEEYVFLKDLLSYRPQDAKAWFYLGNFLYDKTRYTEAAEAWEKATTLNPSLATAHRNLAIAYFNKQQRPLDAQKCLENAFQKNPQDGRILLELDQVSRKNLLPPQSRLKRLKDHLDLVKTRDDLTAEYLNLLNLEGFHRQVLDICLDRQFHPWEGGEGKVPRQYQAALIGLAVKAIQNKSPDEALTLLSQARLYPIRLGEGKLPNTAENNLDWWTGVALSLQGHTAEARAVWEKAAQGNQKPASMFFYNDQPSEMIFYQGLARLQLGDTSGASNRFYALTDYAETHLFDKISIDYFAVSLPDLSVYDENLERRNYVHCLFLSGLGYWGLGQKSKAFTDWTTALKNEAAHLSLASHYLWASEGLL